jgi:hypothetical protein
MSFKPILPHHLPQRILGAHEWILVWLRIATSKFCVALRRMDAFTGTSMAFERFLERGICRAEGVTAIIKGEVIEAYPTDRPYPSCLILYAVAGSVHVVAAADSAAHICHIITAYRTDLEHFEQDLRTRRIKP